MMNKEVKVIDEQLFATILFIGSLLISLSLTIDNRRKALNQRRLYTNKTARNTSIFNRIFVIIIVLLYIDIDIENLNIAKEGRKKTNLLYLQEFIEFITLGTAIIALYITYKSNNITGTENPTI